MDESVKTRQQPAQEKTQALLRSAQSDMARFFANDRDMEDRMMEMMGPRAQGSRFLMERTEPLYKAGQYTPEQYDYGDTVFSDKDIALINTAALGNPASACHGTWGNKDPSDITNVYSNYVVMYQNLMVTSELRTGSGAFINDTYNAARKLGHEAIADYGSGNKSTLAKLLGNSIKAHNDLAMGTAAFTYKTTPIVKNAERIMALLERDPELKAQSGLEERDYQRYQATTAFAKLYRDQLTARENICRHELGQETLSPEELAQNQSTCLLYYSVRNERLRLVDEKNTSQEAIVFITASTQLDRRRNNLTKELQAVKQVGNSERAAELQTQLDNLQLDKNRTSAELDHLSSTIAVNDSLRWLSEDYDTAKAKLTAFIRQQPEAKALMQKGPSSLDNSAYPWQARMEGERQAEMLRQAPYHPGADALDLSPLVQGNVRKGLFGTTKKNSPLYDAVLQAAETAAKLEKEMLAQKQAGNAAGPEMLKQLSDAYQHLRKEAHAYLEARPNPRTAEGKSRRALISDCFAAADRHVEGIRQTLEAQNRTAEAKQGSTISSPEDRARKEYTDLQQRIRNTEDNPYKDFMKLTLAARNRMTDKLNQTGSPYPEFDMDIKLMMLDSYLKQNPQQAERLAQSKEPDAVNRFVMLDAGPQLNELLGAAPPQQMKGSVTYPPNCVSIMKSFLSENGATQYANRCRENLNSGMAKAFPSERLGRESAPAAPERTRAEGIGISGI